MATQGISDADHIQNRPGSPWQQPWQPVFFHPDLQFSHENLLKFPGLYVTTRHRKLLQRLFFLNDLLDFCPWKVVGKVRKETKSANLNKYCNQYRENFQQGLVDPHLNILIQFPKLNSDWKRPSFTWMS